MALECLALDNQIEDWRRDIINHLSYPNNPASRKVKVMKFGNIQKALAANMQPIIKPWPFRGWVLDIIGKIFPVSSKGHHFILVATDYFTKWVEAVPLKKGTMFTRGEVKAFMEDYGVKLLTSTPCYAQANGQAKASNKVMISILQKTIEDNPIAWHKILQETLWAYRISKRTNTATSPFALTYGHDAESRIENWANGLQIGKGPSRCIEFSKAVHAG
ncbi:uncharacterized protein LOC119995552 [Tripterygium wilfordii]|uniref:uncharacterized protein LOC119995552 n=1 Tax=Tripterygium wilfordii TaxID=458696 RepID=UPI0018F84993|nr:uncharacterized protein LOC119995552 [Tripterygium wilfordii]